MKAAFLCRTRSDLLVIIGNDSAEETFSISWNPNGLPEEDLNNISKDLGGLLQQIRARYRNERMTPALTTHVYGEVMAAYQAATWEWKERVDFNILEQALYP